MTDHYEDNVPSWVDDDEPAVNPVFTALDDDRYLGRIGRPKALEWQAVLEALETTPVRAKKLSHAWPELVNFIACGGEDVYYVDPRYRPDLAQIFQDSEQGLRVRHRLIRYVLRQPKAPKGFTGDAAREWQDLQNQLISHKLSEGILRLQREFLRVSRPSSIPATSNPQVRELLNSTTCSVSKPISIDGTKVIFATASKTNGTRKVTYSLVHLGKSDWILTTKVLAMSALEHLLRTPGTPIHVETLHQQIGSRISRDHRNAASKLIGQMRRVLRNSKQEIAKTIADRLSAKNSEYLYES